MDYRKTIILFFITVFLFLVNAYSQHVKKINLKPDSTRFEIKQDSKSKDILNITTAISFVHAKTLKTKGGNFVTLESEGLIKIFGKGKPNLPVYSKLIEVPLDAKVEFSILSYDEEIIELKRHGIYDKIVPAQPSLSKSDDPEKVPFYYDSLAYSKNEFIYTKITSFEDLGILRSIRLIRVEIRPIQYNPVQNNLKILNNLKIEIKFIGADHSKTNQLKSKYSSFLFDKIFEKTVPNFESKIKQLIEETITYVIISDRMFESTLQPFILWKEILGYNVIVAYTDEPDVGNTTTSIKAYLENIYNSPPNGIQPPHYLLLAGDVAQIPSFSNATEDHVTDLYYCEYTGDAFPEVFYGRFSATNTNQLQPQIVKTLEYEQYTMPDPSYIHEALLVAGFDAYGHAETWGNGQINYGTGYYFNSDNGITSHAYLQPEPSGVNYSENIIADINNGSGFANYTAHCSPDGWSDPVFSVDDILSLTNSHKYGLWVGNCCQSNRFNVNECFGEAALRAQNCGAVGYIGASNSTFWDEDFWWAVGFKTVSENPIYDANYLGAYDRLFHTHGEPTSEWYSTQGQIIIGGNLAVQGSTSEDKEYYWEIYHLMGDPSLEFRTTSPEMFNIVHPAIAPTINNNFIVAVKKGSSIMIPDAQVTLIINGEIIDTKPTANSYPDKGTAKFSYNLSPGIMTIYVTKPNYVPYLGTCQLKSYIGELWVSLHGGLTKPFDEWYEDTFCFNSIVNLEYHFGLKWAVVLEVAYNDFKWVDLNKHFPWWNISATARYYYPLAKFKPFINIGPGCYIPDEGDTRFGVKIGLGIDYPITDRINIEIGTDYHNIFKGSKERLNQNNKTSFQHFHAGITYKLR